MNQGFILEFLRTEGVELVSEDLCGELGRVLHFHTDMYQVLGKFIPKERTVSLEHRELGFRERNPEIPEEREGLVILFQV